MNRPHCDRTVGHRPTEWGSEPIKCKRTVGVTSWLDTAGNVVHSCSDHIGALLFRFPPLAELRPYVVKPNLESRFWAKVDKSAGPGACWPWTAGLYPSGYGQFSIGVSRTDRHTHAAHRIAYESVVGTIPLGLELDHLCRNRRCVNPAHLEPVTHRENSLRGVGSPAQNARKVRCKRGHDDFRVNLDGSRTCRTCHAVDARRYRRLAVTESEHRLMDGNR